MFFFVFSTGLVQFFRVPTAQGKQGKWTKKFPVRENTGNLELLLKHRENTGNLVLQIVHSRFSEVNRYFDICCKNFHFLGGSWVSQFCVCYSHKSRKLAQGKFAVGQGNHMEFKNARYRFSRKPLFFHT